MTLLYNTTKPILSKNIIACSNYSKRNLMGFVRSTLGLDPPPSPNDPTPENRFHPWETSPCDDLRERAARIKTMAKCPVSNLDINYTCPISGIPTHHSRKEWEMDTNYHKNHIADILKKVNIYEHDLRSGRPFPEFDFPREQEYDTVINLINWDLYFYTRNFFSMDTEFQLAAVTKMLSYPMTIASVLHQFSPYSLTPKGPVTLEGLKSLAALRYTLNNNSLSDTSSGNSDSTTITATSKNRPMRIFILGARAEAQLPPHVWKQLQYLFPNSNFEIHFIGPESLLSKDKSHYVTSTTPITKRIDDSMSLVYHTDYFHVYHKAQDFYPYDPYFDIFFMFHPGLAATKETWLNETMQGLLDSKCPIFMTGFHEKDITADISVLNKNFSKDMDILMKPVKNVFGSTKWELNDSNPQEVYQFNMYIAGYRGKRYHATETGKS
ncbi:hypothetical protein TBLA_0E00500 [Henningerozyma blattae CBS 6284]|uniref:Uncharacterized protein n=1 Tax=Henningerozyma blattae (strain ATCC 34711 / CBS 6284 / DSM 70876 / NBRC 10599 / NRRL Y-10934 / UCD 77-7) TaxID=1071380 RepID=I2H409_HENB6|nr:hypothetical protein TBLA_0E00500 [Tetrapisispora blattae CBS 6284]CCH61111.1 hypothetical protein TBLA_0E00500 [Tetrapisispora blattae CBS 6284]